jgi:ABC-type phosphate/phosphonate transport system permease subunit
MLGVTVFGVFLTPVFFFVIDRFARWQHWHQGWIAKTSRLTLDLLRGGPAIRAANRTWRWLAPPATKTTSQKQSDPSDAPSSPR